MCERGKKKGRNNSEGVKICIQICEDSLKDKLLSEDGVLPLPWVSLSHLDTVQVDVAVGIGEILPWQLVGLLHIQHQAAHLRDKRNNQDLARKKCKDML